MALKNTIKSFKILLITLFITIYGYQQAFSKNIQELVYGDFNINRKPIFKEIALPEVNLKNLKEKIQLNTNGYNIHIQFGNDLNNYETKISVWSESNLINLFEKKISYSIRQDRLYKVVSFDVDNNGLCDIVLFSYPIAPSGMSASLHYCTIILFYGNKFDILEMNSFLGGIDNFIDIDGDSAYEYICIKYVDLIIPYVGQRMYYIRNIFSFEDSSLINITKRFIGKFPIVFDIDDMRFTEEIPERLHECLFFELPYGFE